MKGVFLRKDNGKQLTTTRIIEGDELIQVNVGTVQDPGRERAHCAENSSQICRLNKPLRSLLSSELQLRRRGRQEDL